MVNFGLNSASILGIFLAVAGAGLYFLRSVRPELSRDQDIFFAAVGLLCGLILLFQGWRLDPILQFGQFLLTGSTIFFAVETIRLRGVTTEQARRGSPIVDDERRVSRTRVYTEAALDRLEPYDQAEDYESDRSDKRRLRGYADPSERRESDYRNEEPRTSRNRRPSRNSYESEQESVRKRRPRSSSRYEDSQNYDFWQDNPDEWQQSSRSRPRRPQSDLDSSSSSSRRRPQRSDDRPSRPRSDSYVDYQPIDESDNNPAASEPESNPSNNPSQNPSVRFDY